MPLRLVDYHCPVCGQTCERLVDAHGGEIPDHQPCNCGAIAKRELGAHARPWRGVAKAVRWGEYG